MTLVEQIFSGKRLLVDRLLSQGFSLENEHYNITYRLVDSGFLMCISIHPNGEIEATVMDPELNEPYELHLSNHMIGSFAGGVKEEYQSILQSIADTCYIRDVYQSAQSQFLIDFVRKQYRDELEFLWEHDGNAVWRRADNRKWYGVMVRLSKRKLGLEEDEITELVNLRIDPDTIENTVDHQRIFPGWHMNKRHWVSVILDGQVTNDDLIELLNYSYHKASQR